MDKETLQAYDSHAADFAQEWAEQPSPLDIHETVLRFFTPGPTADIGCGSGRDTAWLQSQGFDVVGYDASPGLVTQASTLHPW